MPELPPSVAEAGAITLHDEFRRAIRVYADRTAVVSPTASLTYAELGLRANRTANALRGLGLRRGDRIAVLAENRPEFIETYLASANLGVTVIALNIRMHHSELAHCINQAQPEVAVGVPGECVVRGPTVMSGYLGDPGATAEAFHGGWLHTGDVMVRHADGTLTYTDRKKYLIKTGGENVYPAEIEQVLAEHEAVSEVGVCGVPDERWGETVKATIVLRAECALSIAEVDEWCRARLAGYKRPRYVEFRTAEQMPRSMTGKLQRHELAALPVTPAQRVPSAG
jgi:acyl-CoA synthetase (AMP-forming)/AMP-acid ligase II